MISSHPSTSDVSAMIELARQAFRTTGLEPRGGRYLRDHDDKRCGCAVGAIHLAMATGRESQRRTFERITGATTHQQREFELGFDSAFRPMQYYDDHFIAASHPWWLLGRHVGIALRPRRYRSERDE
jgi:hypothetical protein